MLIKSKQYVAKRFSRRMGLKPTSVEITIRHSAPEALREFVIQLVYDLGYPPTFARKHICRVLRIRPDADNWSEFPNVDTEANQLIHDCEWYKVYDIIEALYEAIAQHLRDDFKEELNVYFNETGIGWKLENGLIEYRGDEYFEAAVKTVESALEAAKLPTAKTEIVEAMHDLSRRPEPDVTGAVQHSLASLECVVREVTGEKNPTLEELIKRFPAIVPRPLDQAIEKLWGFTSEQGRHLKEGKLPEYNEAELVVAVSAAITTYLAKKIPPPPAEEDSLQF